MTKHPTNVHIGRNIRLHRQLKGLTIAELAELLATTHQQIQRYESGLNGASASALYRLALALRVDVRVFYEELEYNSEVERRHNMHWTTLRAAEVLEANSSPDLRRDLKQLIQTLSAQPMS